MTSKGLRGVGISIFCLTIVGGLILPSLPMDSTGKSQTNWGWTILPLAGWIYGVTTIEQILQRNKLGKDANVWTFGQTLSIALVITSAYDITVVIWRKFITKKDGGLPEGDQGLDEDKKRENNTATA